MKTTSEIINNMTFVKATPTRNYDCGLCHDTGYLATEEGRSVPCSCGSAVVNTQLWKNSGLTSREKFWEMDFVANMEGKRAAYKAVIETVRAGHGWVVLSGDYGVGKSGLLKSAVAACINRGQRAYYRRSEDVLREARSTFDKASQDTSWAVSEKYNEVPVLALDEVDRISLTDWARAFTFSLIDSRYNNRFDTVTIMATNANIYELGPEWRYLTSRMTDGIVVVMKGQSLRGPGRSQSTK